MDKQQPKSRYTARWVDPQGNEHSAYVIAHSLADAEKWAAEYLAMGDNSLIVAEAR